MQQTGPLETVSADISSREELIYLLSRAAELEHNLACIYLFTAFSLKATVDEGGLTDDEAIMVRGWKRRLASVAIEEMLHMAQVANLLTAIGGAPHFRRANFPLAADAYPFGLPLTLEPFSVEVIERFVCYEMPEDGVLGPEQTETMSQIRARRVMLQKSPIASLIATPVQQGCEPFDVDFMSIGEFYHKIERGFDLLPEEELFIGPPVRAEMALCRCGGSSRKPFCDGTHARIGFSSAKLPGRTVDRRDAYQNETFTLLDNRGICQHAGFCTDELASVFKRHQEPWIDATGAPVDRMRAQVDRCPSGALSYAVNGIERPDTVRAPCITVSKDGPYRITGGIPLHEIERMQGASLEHYALCRCGGSKNKPFCDGTHWSNGFEDEAN